VVVVMIKT